MSIPILTTKLHILPPRPNLVHRPRLLERLNNALHHKLILISAPAGFGKTMLVSEWIAKYDHTVAWLSLDENDDEPSRFLRYLIAALQTIKPGIGDVVARLLQSAQSPLLETTLTHLLNEIATISESFALVLDDYHLLDSQPINDALIFLIDHLPPHVHLVITTREDPTLPLARYRSRDELTEIRAADLRFTATEAADFLNQIMGLELSIDEIAVLESRTEGWVAGLQMAALSMQGRADTAGFIQAFTGSHRFVLDYLVEEVLQRQPDQVSNFLVQTSILDQLNGSLCDAVTGKDGGQEMLERLERGNLFVIPLDDDRQWYRYHHLFAEVLQAYARGVEPDEVATLHLRASEWFENNNLPADAIYHAFAAQDFARAADLIELAWRAMDRSFQEATWLGWVKALPDELIPARPVLSTGYAWALLDTGDLEAAEPRLRDAERWLEMESGADKEAEMIVVDRAEFHSLPATIAAARAYLAQALGDLASAEKYAQLALELLPEDDHFYRGIPAVTMGLAYWSRGELEAASHSFTDAIGCFRKADNGLFTIHSISVLAAIKMEQGHLHEAFNTYQQALQVVENQVEPMPLTSANLYRGLGELHWAWGDLNAAMEALLKSEELGKQAGLSERPYRLCVSLALVELAHEDFDHALDLLEEAAGRYQPDRLPDIRPIAAVKARVWVRQDRLTDALGWMRQQNLSYEDNLSYVREYEHITLARMLIAQFRDAPTDDSVVETIDETVSQALELLARLLKAADDGKRIGKVIEILLLQAVAYQATGNIDAALAALQRALTLAAPEGYVRIFVDEGPIMASLLQKTTKEGLAPSYVRQLQDAFDEGDEINPSIQDLVEPLNERELQIVRLAAAGYKNKEIAAELVISLNTVLYHTKNLYGKLGVNKRTLAIIKARDLGLLDS